MQLFKPGMLCRALARCSQGVLRGVSSRSEIVSGDTCALVTACSLELTPFITQLCLFSGFYRALY